MFEKERAQRERRISRMFCKFIAEMCFVRVSFFCRSISALGLLWGAASCNGSGESLPAGVVDEEVFISLTIEKYASKGRAQNQFLPPDSVAKLEKNFWHQSLKKYGASDSAYYVSLAHYAQDPEHLSKMYARVYDSLKTLGSQ